ncbi:MAG TPA: hypothetical protein VII06_34200 [Chloroflexota bacterium]|jgi:hypothetical protein
MVDQTDRVFAWEVLRATAVACMDMSAEVAEALQAHGAQSVEYRRVWEMWRRCMNAMHVLAVRARE